MVEIANALSSALRDHNTKTGRYVYPVQIVHFFGVGPLYTSRELNITYTYSAPEIIDLLREKLHYLHFLYNTMISISFQSALTVHLLLVNCT